MDFTTARLLSSMYHSSDPLAVVSITARISIPRSTGASYSVSISGSANASSRACSGFSFTYLRAISAARSRASGWYVLNQRSRSVCFFSSGSTRSSGRALASSFIIASSASIDARMSVGVFSPIARHSCASALFCASLSCPHSFSRLFISFCVDGTISPFASVGLTMRCAPGAVGRLGSAGLPNQRLKNATDCSSRIGFFMLPSLSRYPIFRIDLYFSGTQFRKSVNACVSGFSTPRPVIYASTIDANCSCCSTDISFWLGSIPSISNSFSVSSIHAWLTTFCPACACLYIPQIFSRYLWWNSWTIVVSFQFFPSTIACSSGSYHPIGFPRPFW